VINKKTKRLSITLIVNLCFLIFSPLLSQAAEVWLTVEDSTGFLGSTGSSVEVSLDNPDDKVGGVQVDLCDVDDYLTPIPEDIENGIFACEPANRATGFWCNVNELDTGCCRVLFVNNQGTLIEKGTGAIFTIKYDVSDDAPGGECRNLDIENVTVANQYGMALEDVTLESGEFCFLPCTTDGECEDNLYCNGEETCNMVSGICEAGSTPCPDDGLYCNGYEGCYEQQDNCFHSCYPHDSICDPLFCDEDEDSCYCSNDDQCADGLYCNGEETCVSGVCQPGTDPCPGHTCNEYTDSCETTTTTTTTPTTTTTISPFYKVSIIPLLATLDSGATLQFNVKTTYGGKEVEGSYSWEIVNGSTIGSTIDESGLFTAGDNTTESEIEETVRVTDITHQNKSATARVTVNKEDHPPECEVRINPSLATVSSGDTLTLSADTIGDECKPGVYEWSIDTEIESTIDQEGNYTAGINDTGSQITDIITVVDHANADISSSADIKVESEGTGKIVNVFPPVLRGSRWIPLPYFLLIIGEDTNFNLSSTISFESEDILKLARLGFGDILLALVLLKASPQEGAVNFTISTKGENVTGEITIELLPQPFTEDYSRVT